MAIQLHPGPDRGDSGKRGKTAGSAPRRPSRPRRTPKALVSLLKEAASEWSADKASRLSAALSYYTIFSIAPLLVMHSATAAEHVARSDPEFQREFAELEAQEREANRVLAEWTAAQAHLEASRSLLSFSKETLRQLEG